MSRYLVLLSTLGIALADYNPWLPVDATVTKVVSRTAYVCPCDDSTSYGSDWNVWESSTTGVSGTTKTDDKSYTTATPYTYSTPDAYTVPSGYSSVCYTNMGSSPAPYSTTWSNSYTDCASTVTSTVNATVTSATTSTVLSTTTTTVIQSTNTLTSTQTATSTSTATVTVTTVVATVTTTTTSTSTNLIPASSGFVPVQSSLPGSSYSGSGGADPIAKRHEGAVRLGRADQPISNGTSPFLGYPNGVSCVAFTSANCSSVATTVTSMQTGSAATTLTSIVTATTAINATATTITTTTATATVTSTSTVASTRTVTSTSVVPGPTVFAACASNNLADTVNGQIIGGIYNGAGLNFNYVRATSAYDCCVQGILFGNGGATSFYVGIATGNNCLIDTRTTCSSGQSSASYQAQLGDQGDGQLVVSNQYCGSFTGTR